METRKEVLSSLEQIPGFKALSLRTAPGFDKERRLNNYYKESEGLQIVNKYILKFGKCPTKPTELQGVILELLGIEKVACDKTPAEDEQTWVNKVIEDAKAYATKHGGTPPTLEMITLKVNIDVPEKLRAAVLAKVSDLPTILSMKPKVAAPF